MLSSLFVAVTTLAVLASAQAPSPSPSAAAAPAASEPASPAPPASDPASGPSSDPASGPAGASTGSPIGFACSPASGSGPSISCARDLRCVLFDQAQPTLGGLCVPNDFEGTDLSSILPSADQFESMFRDLAGSMDSAAGAEGTAPAPAVQAAGRQDSDVIPGRAGMTPEDKVPIKTNAKAQTGAALAPGSGRITTAAMGVALALAAFML
ncbi:hypothetical protein HK105_206065 [Polyrhizophydium stewartii]|uniref:Uncharacterized protein n=1 Tax=Polyrhizophydium stewartii TaxID=2732419 RepID=A0ABR4N4P3_9FUNG